MLACRQAHRLPAVAPAQQVAAGGKAGIRARLAPEDGRRHRKMPPAGVGGDFPWPAANPKRLEGGVFGRLERQRGAADRGRLVRVSQGGSACADHRSSPSPLAWRAPLAWPVRLSWLVAARQHHPTAGRTPPPAGRRRRRPWPPGYGLRVAALPARPAGCGVRGGRRGACAGAAAPGRPVAHGRGGKPGRCIAAASSRPPLRRLPLRVIEVHAAYRRWCDGTALPGDQVLLASAGGLHLPGALACEPPACGSPAPGLVPGRRCGVRARRRRQAGARGRRFPAGAVEPFRTSRFRRLVEQAQVGVFGPFSAHAKPAAKPGGGPPGAGPARVWHRANPPLSHARRVGVTAQGG